MSRKCKCRCNCKCISKRCCPTSCCPTGCGILGGSGQGVIIFIIIALIACQCGKRCC